MKCRDRTTIAHVTVLVGNTATLLLGPNPQRKAIIMSMADSLDKLTIGFNDSIVYGHGPINLSVETTNGSPWIETFTDTILGDAICADWWIVGKNGGYNMTVAEVSYVPGQVEPAFQREEYDDEQEQRIRAGKTTRKSVAQPAIS